MRTPLRILMSTAALAGAISCGAAPQTELNESESQRVAPSTENARLRALVDSADTMFQSRDQIDRSTFSYLFAEELQTANEPSFRRGGLDGFTFRLRLYVWRAFEAALLVRVESDVHSCVVNSLVIQQAEISWKNGDSVGAAPTLRVIRPAQFNRRPAVRANTKLCEALHAQFQSAATIDFALPRDRPGLDGEVWAFELLNAAGHQSFSTFSPPAEIKQAGTAALRLADLDPTSAGSRSLKVK